MASERSGRRGTARLNGADGGANGGVDSTQERARPSSLPAFDDALGQLEETVQALEGGHLQLEEALALFERGMRLAQVCQEALDRAELRVRQLVAADDEAGALTVETFELDVE
jgi:exodeoxyribonuclease VII small subunit